MLSQTGPAVRVPSIDCGVRDRWGPVGTVGLARGCTLPGDRISSYSFYCTVLCSAVPCCPVVCGAVLCCAILCAVLCRVLCCGVLCCGVLCCVVLCCVVCCVVLCCVVLCCAVFLYIRVALCCHMLLSHGHCIGPWCPITPSTRGLKCGTCLCSEGGPPRHARFHRSSSQCHSTSPSSTPALPRTRPRIVRRRGAAAWPANCCSACAPATGGPGCSPSPGPAPRRRCSSQPRKWPRPTTRTSSARRRPSRPWRRRAGRGCRGPCRAAPATTSGGRCRRCTAGAFCRCGAGGGGGDQGFEDGARAVVSWCHLPGPAPSGAVARGPGQARAAQYRSECNAVSRSARIPPPPHTQFALCPRPHGSGSPKRAVGMGHAAGAAGKGRCLCLMIREPTTTHFIGLNCSGTASHFLCLPFCCSGRRLWHDWGPLVQVSVVVLCWGGGGGGQGSIRTADNRWRRAGPPPQTKVTIVGNNEVYKREI